MKSRFWIILTALVCFSSLLLAQDVTYNFDKTANFAKYHTYKWVSLSNTAHPNQLVDSQIRAAIDSQLTQKGLTPTTGDNPDLDVAYQVTIDKETQLDTWGTSGAWGFSGTMTTTTSTVNVGTLVIDFFDPAAKKLIWRGQGTKTLNPSKDPQKNQERLEKGVKKILKNFPPHIK